MAGSRAGRIGVDGERKLDSMFRWMAGSRGDGMSAGIDYALATALASAGERVVLNEAQWRTATGGGRSFARKGYAIVEMTST